MKFFVGEREFTFNEATKHIEYNGKTWAPHIRTYGEIKHVFDTEEEYDDSLELYFMYRGVIADDGDEAIFDAHKFRYDITVMQNITLGNEHNKTVWHYHPNNPQGKWYQEIYQVLFGQAVYLIQNTERICYTNASTWDIVNMKSWFGHVTINPSESEILAMANIVSNEFRSIYGEIDSKKWANHFLKKSGWEKNPYYENDLEIEEIDDKIVWVKSMYDDFLTNPEKYSFLK